MVLRNLRQFLKEDARTKRHTSISKVVAGGIGMTTKSRRRRCFLKLAGRRGEPKGELAPARRQISAEQSAQWHLLEQHQGHVCGDRGAGGICEGERRIRPERPRWRSGWMGRRKRKSPSVGRISSRLTARLVIEGDDLGQRRPCDRGETCWQDSAICECLPDGVQQRGHRFLPPGWR
jgi:hypothetical protein